MTSHSAVRGESNPPYSRKRSSTVSSTSMFKNITTVPLQIGDQTTMSTWVSDNLSVPVVLNHDCWPGVAAGDMIKVTTQANTEYPGFLFIVRDDAGLTRQTQQQVHFFEYILPNRSLTCSESSDHGSQDHCRHLWVHKPSGSDPHESGQGQIHSGLLRDSFSGSISGSMRYVANRGHFARPMRLFRSRNQLHGFCCWNNSEHLHPGLKG